MRGTLYSSIIREEKVPDISRGAPAAHPPGPEPDLHYYGVPVFYNLVIKICLQIYTEN